LQNLLGEFVFRQSIDVMGINQDICVDKGLSSTLAIS
jgi:hypothetical protein